MERDQSEDDSPFADPLAPSTTMLRPPSRELVRPLKTPTLQPLPISLNINTAEPSLQQHILQLPRASIPRLPRAANTQLPRAVLPRSTLPLVRSPQMSSRPKQISMPSSLNVNRCDVNSKRRADIVKNVLIVNSKPFLNFSDKNVTKSDRFSQIASTSTWT